MRRLSFRITTGVLLGFLLWYNFMRTETVTVFNLGNSYAFKVGQNTYTTLHSLSEDNKQNIIFTLEDRDIAVLSSVTGIISQEEHNMKVKWFEDPVTSVEVGDRDIIMGDSGSPYYDDNNYLRGVIIGIDTNNINNVLVASPTNK